MAGRHHILFGNPAFVMARYSSCPRFKSIDASVARAHHAVHPHCFISIDGNDSSGGLAHELCQGLHSKLFRFI